MADLQPMYHGMVNSPVTMTSAPITIDALSIPIMDVANLPPGPNIAVLGQGPDAETIMYTSVNINTSSIEVSKRAFEGVAKAWPSGTPIARNFTNYDFNTMIDNIKAMDDTVKAANLVDIANKFTEIDTDYVTRVRYAVTAGSANAYTVTLNPAPKTLIEGMVVSIKIHAANAGAATLNINGLGAKSILKGNGLALTSGNLKLNSIYTVRYNGSNFILQGEGGEYGTAVASDVLSGKTIGTENGLVTGSMPNRGSLYITPQVTSQSWGAGYYNSVYCYAGVEVKTIYGIGSAFTIPHGVTTFNLTFSGFPFTPDLVRDTFIMSLPALDTNYGSGTLGGTFQGGRITSIQSGQAYFDPISVGYGYVTIRFTCTGTYLYSQTIPANYCSMTIIRGLKL